MENISGPTDFQILMYQLLSTEKNSQMCTHLPSPLFLYALSAEVKLSLTVCSRGALSISIPLSFFTTAESTSPSYKNNTKQKPTFRKHHINSIARSLTYSRKTNTYHLCQVIGTILGQVGNRKKRQRLPYMLVGVEMDENR